jgi:hypothetical protein
MLAALALGVGALWSASASLAATYDVEVCGRTASGADISVSEDPGSSGYRTGNSCGSLSPAEGIEQGSAGRGMVSGGLRWTLSAPQGATIKSLRYIRIGVGMWDPGMAWELTADGTLLESVSGPSLTETKSFPAVGAGSVVSHLFCPVGPCVADHTFTRLLSIGATVEDDQAPTATIDPALADGSVVWDAIQVPYHSADEGGGVKATELLVDGAPVAGESDSNGGKCVTPFKRMAPCKATIASSFPLDTTALPEGSHTLAVVATDAAGQSSTPVPLSVEVHNAAFAIEPPQLSGKAELGAILATTTGSWGGLPSTFAFQWLRCPPSLTAGEAGCDPIAGATADRYTAVVDDIGKRLVAKVTATNVLGSKPSLSAPSDVVPDQLTNRAAPTISGAAKVGSPLSLDTGRWEDLAGSQPSFSEQWLRCPPSVTAASAGECKAIAGATAATYTPAKADAGMRIVASVTASVSSPQALSATAGSAPSDVVADSAGPEGNGANPPQTTLARHPRRKSALRASSFTFTADQPGATFQCKLDKGPFKPCRSPFKRRVQPGRHSFQVRAVSATGTADPTPATYRWRVSG